MAHNSSSWSGSNESSPTSRFNVAFRSATDTLSSQSSSPEEYLSARGNGKSILSTTHVRSQGHRRPSAPPAEPPRAFHSADGISQYSGRHGISQYSGRHGIKQYSGRHGINEYSGRQLSESDQGRYSNHILALANAIARLLNGKYQDVNAIAAPVPTSPAAAMTKRTTIHCGYRNRGNNHLLPANSLSDQLNKCRNLKPPSQHICGCILASTSECLICMLASALFLPQELTHLVKKASMIAACDLSLWQRSMTWWSCARTLCTAR